MPGCDSGALASSSSLPIRGHPGRCQAKTPLSPPFKFAEPPLDLHWTLDVIMNGDQARNRLDDGPNNLAVPSHMALNILNAEKSKIPNRRKIKRAGWSNAFLANLLARV